MMRGYKPVRGGVMLALVYVADATHNDLTNSPEHLQHLGSRGSQTDRHDLTAVCRRVGDEDAPWDSLQKLGHEHDGQRLGKVEDNDESVQDHEGRNGGPAVSDTTGERTGETDSNNGTKRTSHLEGRLPRCLNRIFSILV